MWFNFSNRLFREKLVLLSDRWGTRVRNFQNSTLVLGCAVEQLLYLSGFIPIKLT